MFFNLRLAFEVKDNISERKSEIPDPNDIITDLKEERERCLERSKELSGADGKRKKCRAERILRCIKEIKYLMENDSWESFVKKVKNDDYEIPTKFPRGKRGDRPDLSDYEP